MEFHRLALGAERLNWMLLLADEANEQTARSSRRRRDETLARQNLFSVLRQPREEVEEGGSTLLAALRVIGEREGIAFREPPRYGMRDGGEISLLDILNASEVRVRKVQLSAEDQWWLGDSGAMLGFRREDNRPVALVPGMAGRYRAVDPVTGQSV